MANCNICSVELPQDSLYCYKCGKQVGITTDEYSISSDGLIGKVKEIVNDVKVKRIIVKDEKGKILLSIPITWGAAGAMATVFLAPWLAALGVIAGIVTKCKIEVEKES